MILKNGGETAARLDRGMVCTETKEAENCSLAGTFWTICLVLFLAVQILLAVSVIVYRVLLPKGMPAKQITVYTEEIVPVDQATHRYYEVRQEKGAYVIAYLKKTQYGSKSVVITKASRIPVYQQPGESTPSISCYRLVPENAVLRHLLFPMKTYIYVFHIPGDRYLPYPHIRK